MSLVNIKRWIRRIPELSKRPDTRENEILSMIDSISRILGIYFIKHESGPTLRDSLEMFDEQTEESLFNLDTKNIIYRINEMQKEISAMRKEIEDLKNKRGK